MPGNKRPVDVCSVIQVPWETYLLFMLKISCSISCSIRYMHQLELGIDDIPRENEKKYKDGIQV